ncbi:MAG: DUF1848 domain-containing protein [Bacteroidales bacterium]|nr:DUF1848 domain-containing protein [Bacteroidales bacterium]
MRNHQHIEIKNEQGKRVTALSPVIVSASRATDIPAFYVDSFFKSLDRGYTIWNNPFNGKPSYVSYANTRFIVFWSKNPKPLAPYLPRLKDKGIGFYIQFTLNDYEKEGLEPNVPSIQDRIDTFKRIVDQYGLGHIIWRFDPLILTDKIGIDELLGKIRKIEAQLRGYTEKLVFSFADIAGYRKVGMNLSNAGVSYYEWTDLQMLEFARELSKLNDTELGLQLATCAESLDLEQYGIQHNRCIDPDLIGRLSPDDPVLQMWLFGSSKDKGQRKACGCILSKDIGTYNTCPHGCLYCYANTTPQSAIHNYKLTRSLI